MNVIKIEKSKYLRLCLTLLSAIALIFITSLIYFLGWAFEINTFWIYITIMAVEIVALMLLYFVLIKANKSYYLITADSIKMFKGNQELFTLAVSNIVKINYVKFAWTLLMQMGAGYLHFEFTDGTGQIKPSISYPNGKKIYSISMSSKQAKQVSNMVKRDLQVM